MSEQVRGAQLHPFFVAAEGESLTRFTCMPLSYKKSYQSIRRVRGFNCFKNDKVVKVVTVENRALDQTVQVLRSYIGIDRKSVSVSLDHVLQQQSVLPRLAREQCCGFP